MFLLFGVQQTQAQTAEEIVDTYLETIGGEDAWTAIKSIKMSGKANTQGMEIPMTMYSKAPGKQRVDINFQGQTLTQMAFDGETGWGVNFMTMEAEKWNQEQSTMAKASMDFPDPFLNYAEKGYSISLEGEESVEGTDCFKIKLTRKPVMVDGKEEENFSYHFFDKETFVPIMQQDFAKAGPTKGMAQETYFSDYQEAGDVYFPYTMTTKINGQTAATISIEEIELNAEVEDKLFDYPEKKTEGGGKN